MFAKLQYRLQNLPASLLYWLTLLLLLFFLGCAELLVFEEQAGRGAEQRVQAWHEAGNLRVLIESELNATAHIASGVASYIVARKGQIESADITPMLAELYRQGRHIRNIGIAPANRLNFIYPLVGNEAALGLYYPEVPTQWPAVRSAIEKRQPSLAGPVRMLQGGEALIYRIPVYIDQTYWGLISTAIDNERLFRHLRTLGRTLPAGFALRGRDGKGSEGEIFMGDPAAFDGNSLLLDIRIPGGSWQMAAPLPPSQGKPLVRIAAWSVALLLTGLCHLLLRALVRQGETLQALRRTESALSGQRDRLEEEVRLRTAELSHARDRAEAASRAKSRFLANISHEIRTPLNAVIGLSYILQRQQPRPEQADKLKRIDIAANHLLELLNNILDLARIEAGKLELQHEEIVPEVLAETVNAMFAEQLRQRDIAFTVNLAGMPKMLFGDSLRLGQMLINYVGNAAKFTTHGHIEVTVDCLEEKDDCARLHFCVCDTGIGLSSEQLGRIFAPFEQGDNSTTRRFGGSGLGLAICRVLAQAMDGDCGAESRLGEGSCFWFTVRLSKNAEKPALTVENHESEALRV